MLDPIINFSEVTVSTGYNSAATTITLASGNRAKLPAVADGDSNGVWYNATDYPNIIDDPLKEIVRRTDNGAGAEDIVITRAQEGTTAQNHNIAGKVYKIAFGITKKTYDDIIAMIDTPNATEDTDPADADLFSLFVSNVLKKLSFLNLKLAIMSALNPVGTIRSFAVSTNPATLLGFGTWSAHGAGRVEVCLDSGDTDFDTVNETGGASTVTLTSSESGLVSHNHTQNAHAHTRADYFNISTAAVNAAGGTAKYGGDGVDHSTPHATATNNAVSAANASSAHENKMKYIVVYRWVRTA